MAKGKGPSVEVRKTRSTDHSTEVEKSRSKDLSIEVEKPSGKDPYVEVKKTSYVSIVWYSLWREADTS